MRYGTIGRHDNQSARRPQLANAGLLSEKGGTETIDPPELFMPHPAIVPNHNAVVMGGAAGIGLAAAGRFAADWDDHLADPRVDWWP